ncbi:MAG: hypothetical protein DRH23_06285 [Deltaproteobacteria bacterium]|nr:MAG: hypothetical protein DRH23_06285 [Deltaproteobacteria bacterium]
MLVVSEFDVRMSDHVVAIVGSFRHQFVEIGNVLREPLTALGASPKSTLHCRNFNGRAAVENEVVSISSSSRSSSR